MGPILMTLLLGASLAVLATTLYLRFSLLAAMAGENRIDRPWERLRLLLRIGFGQSKLVSREKERSSGAMHFFIFWGALLIGLREFILVGEGFTHGFSEHLPFLGSGWLTGFLYVFAYNVTEVVVTLMLLFALYRRSVLKVRRLDLNWEGVVVLWFILGIMVTDLVFDAARFNLIALGHDLHYLNSPVWGSEMTWAPFASLLASAMAPWGELANAGFYQFGYWGHMVVALTFANILPYTKQFHELTALPNVYFGSLDYPHAPAALLDLENEEAWENEALGVARVEQLTWKQGLDVYTCTECGRCYDVCPTYVTGKPLALKWVNDAIRGHLEDQAHAIRKTGRSSEDVQLVGDVIRHDTLWACTTCRACEEVCPVSIEHVPRIIAMRQGQTLMAEAYPKELTPTFRGLEQNGNPWNLGYDQRAEWGAELDFDLPILTEPPEEDFDVLMWVGCMGSFDKRSQKVAQATATLLRKAGVNFAILGNAEKCSGDLARRTGNEMLYQTLARENVDTLNALKVRAVVTQCPHCLNALKHEYPQLEGRYEVYHHSQYIAKLVEEGRLDVAGKLEGGVTYHDPCYLGRYNNEYDAPRALVTQAAGEAPIEMTRHGNEGFCCGAGGGRMWMEENIGRRVNEERVRQAAETGAKTIATGCPFCMTMLQDGVRQTGREDDLQIKDIAELVLEALERG